MNARVNFTKMHGATAPSRKSLMGSTEFVVFQLNEREYGIDIRQVQRVRSFRSLTRIVNGADYVEGVAISNGVIMPIVDMRRHVNIALPTFNHVTAVMILNILNRSIGLVVDSVSEVVSLTADQMRPVLSLAEAAALKADYLIGIATHEGRSLILLDIQKLLQGAGNEALQTA